jgi:aminocarboxymuconate-semialdehyde decarboxylase
MRERGVIDFHAHVVHPDVYARTINHCVSTFYGKLRRDERPGPQSPNWKNFQRMTDPAVQLADMDARGVSMAVISTSTVSQGTFWAEAAEAAELDRMANEGIADWVRRHPDRFRGAATLPLQSMPHALAELDYCIDTLGIRIVNLPAAINNLYLGDPCYRDLWTMIEKRGVVAFLHPDGIRDPAFQKFSLWNGIGQGIEETRLMSSLIYEGVLERHPDLKIVMAHAGGFLPLYIARLDRNATAHPPSMVNITRKPSSYLRQFHYDTVSYDPWIVDALSERIGSDRVLFGTDYPFGDPDPIAMIAQTKLDAGQRDAVLYDNGAARLDHR